MEDEIRVKFIVSEDIQTQQVANSPILQNLIINPLMVMRSKWIPTTLSMGISIVTSGIDFSIPRTVQIFITNVQNGNRIYDSGEQKINMPQMGMSDNFNFNLEIKNADFENEGRYDISLVLDNEVYSDYFKVLKAIGN